MQVFPRETTDYIETKLVAYFRHRDTLSLGDAKTMIDYVSGPGTGPQDSISIDPSKPHITGGGGTRPSKSQIDKILMRIEDAAEWREVFDDLMERSRGDRDAEDILKYAFNGRCTEDQICERLCLGRSTFYEHRSTVLERAGVLAVQSGLIKY